jgi:hypothetical protein
LGDTGIRPKIDQDQAKRIEDLEDHLKGLTGGDAVFWAPPGMPAEIWESSLEDVLAFESVGSGTSLFEGLQEHGLDLPQPEKLDERQSVEKVAEVLHALAALGIFLVGFDHLDTREFYSTLWNETLWEGCYVEKRNPGAMTIIDVSHRMSRSEIMQTLEDMQKTASVH